MRMTISTCLEHLEELDLISDFEQNELTILRLSYYLKVKFSKVEKHLYKNGYPKAITNNTIVDSDWLPIIFGLKPRKRLVSKSPGSKTKEEVISFGPKPRNKVLLRNWIKRKNDLNNQKLTKPIFIRTPMGGKVK